MLTICWELTSEYGGKPVVSNVATNSRSRLFFICPFIPVKGIIQVFLETKKELLKLKRKKKQFFVLLVLKLISGRFIDWRIHNKFITIKADNRLYDTTAKSA